MAVPMRSIETGREWALAQAEAARRSPERLRAVAEMRRRGYTPSMGYFRGAPIYCDSQVEIMVARMRIEMERPGAPEGVVTGVTA